MKKKIITAAFVAAIAIFARTTVYNTQKPEAMSEVALANVEALADPEVSIEYICKGNILGCYDGTYDHFFLGIRQ